MTGACRDAVGARVGAKTGLGRVRSSFVPAWHGWLGARVVIGHDMLWGGHRQDPQTSTALCTMLGRAEDAGCAPMTPVWCLLLWNQVGLAGLGRAGGQ